MKKVLYVTATVAVCLFCCTFFCACDSNDGSGKIAAPVGLGVSAREILSWDEVEGASGYTVRVDGEEFVVETAELDLFYLRHGTHEISIMTRSDTLASSDWSQTFTYELPYPQGITTYSNDGGQTYRIKVTNSNIVRGKIVIPDAYNGKSISIVDLSGCDKITSVVMPDTVTGFSLEGCTALQRVKISDSVTRLSNLSSHSGTLRGCSSLTELDLPAAIEEVSGHALDGTAITNIYFPASVDFIDPWCLYDTNELTEITVDEENRVYKSEGNCIIRREDNAVVRGCKTSAIPDYCTSIDDYAFRNIKDLDLRIPASVTRIGDNGEDGYFIYIFDKDVKSITIDEDNPVFKYDGNCIIEKNTNEVLYVGNNYVIPEYCTAIGPRAFGHNKDEEIVIPDNIEVIGQSAFIGRLDLKSVHMGSGVKTIGESAFEYCENLNFVDFGNVETIGIGAFRNCKAIETIIFRSSLKRIEAEAFFYTNVNIVIPRSVEYVGRRAFVKFDELDRSNIFIPYDSLQAANAETLIFMSGSISSSIAVFGCEYAETDLSGVYLTSVKDMSSRDADLNSPNQTASANRSICLPVRYGYEFTGWSVDRDGAAASYGVFDSAESDGSTVKRTYMYDSVYHHHVLDGSVLYAVWTSAN